MAPLRLVLSALGLLATAVIAAPMPDADSDLDTTSGGDNRASRVLGVPIINPDARDRIPGAYIVVYNSSASDAAVDAHQAHFIAKVAKRNLERRQAVDNQTQPADNSTSSTPSADTAVRTFHVGDWRAMALQDAEDRTMLEIFGDQEVVAYIEQDATVHTQALATESDAPSGLERLSHASVSDDNSGYVYDDSAGDGITAFVVDTGIYLEHTEFQGRAVFGANFVNDVDTDENGHGSHVSGTIGGRTYGVAKNIQLVAVKVLNANGAGSNSGVIAGMNWVAANATASGLRGKAVMNMSLGGSKSQAINDAVAGIVAAGVVPCVAAGNDNTDASTESPASAPGAIAVGAIDQTNDARASFSNYGSTVAVFAPGVNVLSAWITDDTSTNTLSGTSMATPHVTGLAAYLMAFENITDPTAVLARIQQLAGATGAQVKNNQGETTGLIANNGNL